MQRKRAIIMGAAGRDFHNFNVYFKNNPYYEVVAFTAAQIPGIANRKYPGKLAGKLYPKGIPILPEEQLAELIRKFQVSKVFFAYSDVSHLELMHKASIVLSCGASFVLLGPEETMLKSKKPVIAVCAVRTGCGKSQTTRRIAEIFKKHGKKTIIVRHPMPYGTLERQEVEKFESLKDLEKFKCTIEEREEFEPLINEGFTVFAGVNYEKILKKAENQADVIIWDGGNNDFPFFKPDFLFCITDPFRAGHELLYHPGEVNFRMADVILINKMNTAKRKNIEEILQNAKMLNPRAVILKANSEIYCENAKKIKGKRVVVIEDGPTVTHGGMPFGVAVLTARKFKAKIVKVENQAVGSLKFVFKEFPHLKNVLPAMGYSSEQLKELGETINKTNADFVLSGTPVNLSRILKVNKQVLHVSYRLKEIGKHRIEEELKAKGFL